jgi:hypothetical protein
MEEDTKNFAFEVVRLRTELEAARKVVEAARAIVSSEGPPDDNELTSLRSDIAFYDAIVTKQQPSAPDENESANG